MVNTLIGPLKSDPTYKEILSSFEILGDYTASLDVLSFYPIDLVTKLVPDTNVEQIYKKLIEGWIPEQLIFWGIENSFIPDGIENFEGKLIGVLLNHNLYFDITLKNISRFDWIFTDKKGEQVLKNLGFQNVSSFNFKAYSPYLHRKALYKVNKEIDITFIGTFNSPFYKNRDKWLYRLAKLSDKYNIKIIDGLYGEDYVNVLNQSKIVFNYSENNLVNQRCFEVPICNALLFVEEDNLEIRNYFNDKEHCVYYNNDNFEELIEYYLTNEEERNTITKNGYKKAQKYTFEFMFENLLSKIDDLDRDEIRKNRLFDTCSEVEKLRIVSDQAFQSFSNGKYYVVEKNIKSILEKEPFNVEALNNLGAIYANAYINLSKKQNKEILKRAKASFEEAINKSQFYVIARFNLGMLLFFEGDYKESEKVLNSALMAISSDISSSLKYRGYLYASENITMIDDFKLEWEEISFSIQDEEEELFAYGDLLVQKILETLGDIALKENDDDLAEEMYKGALQVSITVNKAMFKLAELLFRKEHFLEAYQYYTQIDLEKPFYIENKFKLISCCKHLNKNEEYDKLKAEFLTISKFLSKSEDYESKFFALDSLFINSEK